MTMLENSQQKLFTETELPKSTLSQEASHAKTLALQETKRELAQTQEADYGQNVNVLLAKYDPISQSLRTSQTCFLAQAKNEGDGLAEYSATWPKSGMMRNGMIYQLHTLEHGTGGAEFGYLPTPTTTADSKGAPKNRFYNSPTCRSNLREVLRNGPDDPIYPHPTFVERLMGFPIGHTDLNR